MPDIKQKTKQWYVKIKILWSSFSHGGIRPKRDWQILLVLTLVVVLISAGLAFYLYIGVDSGTLFSATVVEKPKGIIINQKFLQKIVDDSVAREKANASIDTNKNIPADPSL